MLNWHTFYPQCSTHPRTHILRPMTLPGNGYLHVPIVGQEAENKPQQQHFPRLAVVPPWPVSSVSTNLSTTSLSLSLSLSRCLPGFPRPPSSRNNSSPSRRPSSPFAVIAPSRFPSSSSYSGRAGASSVEVPEFHRWDASSFFRPLN